MRKEEIERLRYRNQYLLVPESVECPFLHEEHIINDSYRLYNHIDLQVTKSTSESVNIWLLGDLFDYEYPQKSNSDILADLINSNYRELLQKIGKYAGRFVLIYQNEQGLNLVHDATAARKIYYAKSGSTGWFSSQAHLLARILGFKETSHPEILDYYNSQEFRDLFNSNIGDTTIYDEVRQLMPNHFYNVKTSSKIRYWPFCRSEEKPMKEAAGTCASMVRGYMESITHRYEVMLPVTAGKDSRTLLAATKSNPDRVFYYINKRKNLDEKFHDIAVPKKLLNDLGLDFHILDTDIEVDEDFRRVYFENNKYASDKYLSVIYNYYVNYGHKVNLPGNTATAGIEWFMGTKIPVTAENLAKKNQVDRWGYAIEYYKQWIEELHESCPENNIRLLDLFYWEERIANWGNQVQQEKDIAQEDINIFNSRDLVTHYLSVDSKYLEMHNLKVHLEVIRKLWPEVLKVPINRFFKNSVFIALKTGGMLNLYQKLKYA